MLNLFDLIPPATLLVLALMATILMLGVFAVSLDGLIQRCRAIPAQVNGMKHTLQIVQADIKTAKELAKADQDAIETLKQQIVDGEAELDTKAKNFERAKTASGTPVIVVDQTIQPAFEPWLVLVKRQANDPRNNGPLASAWVAGRHFVVFAEDATNAGRRVVARFPANLGYGCGPPEPFPFLMGEG
ncbi:MAG TPA: hypothetical protein VNT30_17715 [Stellaceae bacterium]|nr:hypothetical protein [Stellaceae bacterium]